jgi:hypothetical protein
MIPDRKGLQLLAEAALSHPHRARVGDDHGEFVRLNAWNLYIGEDVAGQYRSPRFSRRTAIDIERIDRLWSVQFLRQLSASS